MELETSHFTSVNVLKISGSFDIYTAGEVRDWFGETISNSQANIVVDLSEVTFIDSTALATLVQGMKQAREMNGDIRISGLQEPVRMVLELTRLDSVFEIYPKQTDAVQAYEKEY